MIASYFYSMPLVGREFLTLSPRWTETYSMVGAAGIEPATPGLEGRCSIQLSYAPAAECPAKSIVAEAQHSSAGTGNG
jgi:hypothetical protein